MSTPHTAFRRRVRRGALALAVGAICLAPASALAAGDTKYDYPGTPPQAPAYVAPKAGDTPADFPGMPDGPVVVPGVGSRAEGSSFDWTSAAVGAGGAGLLIVVALGGASAASRVRTTRSA
jgi:hypothetical protein